MSLDQIYKFCQESSTFFFKLFFLSASFRCSKPFQLRSHLEHHIKTTHILKKALSKCDQCDRTFIKPSDLEAHKRSHSNDKKYECKVCGRRYKSLGNLNHHAKSHDTKKPFTCEVCSQGFTRKGQNCFSFILISTNY